ncbi:hypothetical protein [Luteolibacter soli]|uniref:Uncharacterized protein n=1 Tax=Luteolibacter soli TaxID=3135280 RepID=A0ABU9AX26_9BACT
MNSMDPVRMMSADPKVLAERLHLLAALVAGQGGEVRIPLDEVRGGERLEFYFDNERNEHVVKLGPAIETVYVGYAPQPVSDPEVAWRTTMPNAWRGIVSRIEGELLALRPGADLNIAGWLDTGEHFILCADQGLRGRAFVVDGVSFVVADTEISGSSDPYRRLSKIVVRRNG